MKIIKGKMFKKLFSFWTYQK